MNKKADTFRIEYKSGESFILKPIFDIHFGSRHCDVRAFKRFLGEPDPKTFYIGGGDWLDSIITADVKRYRKSSDASDPNTDEIIDDQTNKLMAILEPFKGQFVGIGIGNHEDEIVKRCAHNPIKRITKELGCAYLGLSFLTQIIFSYKGGHGRTVVIRGHHGWGGGTRTRGGSLTKYAGDMAYYDADLFMYGHDHQLKTDEVPRLSLKGDTLISKPKTLCLCGTFMKTLSGTSDSTWAESKGFPPATIGGLDIIMRPAHDWVEISVERKSFF